MGKERTFSYMCKARLKKKKSEFNKTVQNFIIAF